MSHGCRCIIEASCTHAAARSPACCRMSNGCRCSAALVGVVTRTEGVTNRAAQLGVTYCSALSKNLAPCCRRNKVRDMRCLPRSSRNIASRRSWCARESTYRCGLLAPNLPKSGPKVGPDLQFWNGPQHITMFNRHMPYEHHRCHMHDLDSFVGASQRKFKKSK